MFSMVTMAWSTSTPTDSARPPSVIRLSVSPRICRMITEVRIDSGIVSAITSVLRQLPRNSSTSAAVRPAAISASIATPDDRGLDEDRLVEQRLDRDLLGHLLGRLGQQRAQVGHDVQRRRAAVLQHRQQHAALAVLAHDVGLRREAVAHEGDVADGGRRAVDGAHRQVVERGDGVGRAVHLHRVFGRSELGGARRQDQVLQVDRVDDVRRRQPARLQRVGVEVDRDQLVLAAVRERDRDAGDVDQLRAQDVDARRRRSTARAASRWTGPAAPPGCWTPST